MFLWHILGKDHQDEEDMDLSSDHSDSGTPRSLYTHIIQSWGFLCVDVKSKNHRTLRELRVAALRGIGFEATLLEILHQHPIADITGYDSMMMIYDVLFMFLFYDVVYDVMRV